jgi:hypothetical protein
MANQTIYGCYSAGSIVFEGQACDSGDYTGCYVSSGDHAGQIAVTVSEYNCDDTYYACFNSGTGQFQLIIPDNCCAEYGDNCSLCPTPTETPLQISVQFSGVSTCNDCNVRSKYVLDFDINSTFVAIQNVDSACVWTTEHIGNVTQTNWEIYDCTGAVTGTTTTPINLVIAKNLTGVDVDVRAENNRGILFFSTGGVSSDGCVGGNDNTNFTFACFIHANICTGGTATITEL